MAKFEVSYSRKIVTKPYESMHIGLVMQFDTNETNVEDAFKQIKNTVNKLLEQEKYYLMYYEEE